MLRLGNETSKKTTYTSDGQLKIELEYNIIFELNLERS